MACNLSFGILMECLYYVSVTIQGIKSSCYAREVEFTTRDSITGATHAKKARVQEGDLIVTKSCSPQLCTGGRNKLYPSLLLGRGLFMPRCVHLLDGHRQWKMNWNWPHSCC